MTLVAFFKLYTNIFCTLTYMCPLTMFNIDTMGLAYHSYFHLDPCSCPHYSSSGTALRLSYKSKLNRLLDALNRSVIATFIQNNSKYLLELLIDYLPCNDALQLAFGLTLWKIVHIIILWSRFY